MKQQIRILKLLQSSLKCLHQIMGQLGDKPNGIAEQHIQCIGDSQPPGGGIQRVKKAIIGRNTRSGQCVEQRGLPCIGIANQRYHRDAVLLPQLSLHTADPSNLLQFLL